MQCELRALSESSAPLLRLFQQLEQQLADLSHSLQLVQKLACLTVALTGSTDLPVPTSGQCGELSLVVAEDADDLSAVGASAQAIVHADDKLAAVAGDGPGAA